MKKSKKIYLDYASATPLEKDVLLAMNKIFKENFANSSAIHDFGLQSKNILNESRKNIAKIIDAY